MRKRRRPEGYWSMQYMGCSSCNTTEIPHNAGGLCKRCYYKTDAQHEIQKAYRDKLRDLVLTTYSEGLLMCACCGEKETKFLSIDHIDGCGLKKRKVERSGTPLYIYLKARNFPPGYQVLCHNCNSAKGYYGECPHKRLSPEEYFMEAIDDA